MPDAKKFLAALPEAPIFVPTAADRAELDTRGPAAFLAKKTHPQKISKNQTFSTNRREF